MAQAVIRRTAELPNLCGLPSCAKPLERADQKWCKDACRKAYARANERAQTILPATTAIAVERAAAAQVDVYREIFELMKYARSTMDMADGTFERVAANRVQLDIIKLIVASAAFQAWLTASSGQGDGLSKQELFALLERFPDALMHVAKKLS